MKKAIFNIYRRLASMLAGHHLGAFYPLRMASNFILGHLRDENAPIIINGQQMFLDKQDSLRLSVHYHESLELAIIKQEVKAGDTALDIGAHIGYFTLPLAELVGSCGKVFALEPNLENFLILKKNVQINNYNNAFLYNLAADKVRGVKKLYLYNSSADSGFFSNKKNRSSLSVKTDRLDDILANNATAVNFIKMDIEGAEPFALKGMERMIGQSRNLKMLIEFYPKMLKIGGTEPRDFLEQLTGYGFKLYVLNKNTRRLASVDQIMRAYPFTCAGNLFCIKN